MMRIGGSGTEAGPEDACRAPRRSCRVISTVGWRKYCCKRLHHATDYLSPLLPINIDPRSSAFSRT
eukprot:689808-Rhodomonas_salina.1